VFFSALVIYLAAGWNLAVRHHAVVGDAMARVANGYYVGFSRDPHLGAVGFVWNPLPSLTTLPLLSLHRWFPVLRTQAFAGNIVSAGFMAAAVAIVWIQLDELHVRRPLAIVLTLVFSLHPLVYQYGANGDSEAALLCFLALACLGVTRYLERRDLGSLVLTGTALGLGYLSRQEFLAAGGAVIMTIMIVAYRAEPGTRVRKRWAALTDGTLAGLPFGFAIVIWAGTALILVGSATSYLDANSEQVTAARSGIADLVGGTGAIDRAGYFAGQLFRMQPGWLLVIGVALVLGWRRRDARFLAPIVTFGAVLAAQGVLFGAGSTFGWLRFSITVVPMTVLLIGVTLSPDGRLADNRRTPGRVLTTSARVVLVATCLLAVPVALGAMVDTHWGREEAASVHFLPGYGFAGSGPGAYPARWLDGYDPVVQWFRAPARRHALVLTDAQYTFPLVLKTDDPHQLVIPSDRDYERSVADPATYHVAYLVVSDGAADTIAASYPELRTADHNSIARLVHTFRAGPNRLRIFRVTRSITGARAGTARG